MPIKCLIVDDEPLAIEILESFVSRVDSLELVASCSNAVSAFDTLKREKVDLLFLDIQMPKLTGIEFLKILNPSPKVVFTTAYRDYAVESYELNVVDYLLKPIAFDRFLMAVNKVVENEEHPSFVVSREPEGPMDSDPYLFLKADRKMVKVHLNEITHIESLKDYIRVKLTGGKEVISLQKIGYMEKRLPAECFLRIHKSFIISLSKIEAYNAATVEVGGMELPIGRSYKSEVMKVLESQSGY